MLAWLRRRVLSRPTPHPDHRSRVVRAKFDSALTSDNNRRHWANADGRPGRFILPAADTDRFMTYSCREAERLIPNRARYSSGATSIAQGLHCHCPDKG
jgi:hypothetical protein